MLAAVVAACVLAVGSVGAPAEASWPDREIVTARFTAKTIPPVTIAGAAPHCSWTNVLTNQTLSMQWALPSGYSLANVTFSAHKDGESQTVTGQSSSLAGGVYTTTIPDTLLEGLGSTFFGGTIAIHVVVRDPATGWMSRAVVYSFTLTLAGIVTGCTAVAT